MSEMSTPGPTGDWRRVRPEDLTDTYVVTLNDHIVGLLHPDGTLGWAEATVYFEREQQPESDRPEPPPPVESAI